MIKKIYMRECATFDNQGAYMDNCKKVNFVYGANGSGKSTIGYFLNDFSKPLFAKSSVEWKDQMHDEIKVYNRDFRKLNFQSGEVPGVFTLGHATITEVSALNKDKENKKKAEDDYKSKSRQFEEKTNEKKKKEEEIKTVVWDQIRKRYSKEFEEAFVGVKKSKDIFYTELIRRRKIYLNDSEPVKSIDDLKSRANVLYAKELENCSEITLNITKDEMIIEEIESSALWQTIIVGNQDIKIGELVKELNNTSWVNQGLEYLTPGSDICPFCQQPTITSELISQFERLFDESYKKKIDGIEQYRKDYKESADNIISAYEMVLENPSNMTIGGINKDDFQKNVQDLSKIFRDNLDIISQKYLMPERKVVLQTVDVIMKKIEAFIITANQEIKKYNLWVEDSETQRKILKDDIWRYCINEQSTVIDTYIKDIDGLSKAIDSISEKISQLKNDIIAFEKLIINREKNITSVKPAVDEINRQLKTFGFSNFHIVPSPDNPNAYQIQREDGTLVTNTLSEGEETFITFLYFMQLTKGATKVDQVSSKRIIVLDDPISSLDANILYIVSVMVRDLIDEVKKEQCDVEQIFVFTHNVFFHKEASYRFGKEQVSKDVNYWIIRKDNGVSIIDSYEMKNPISTSYELLWREIDNANNSIITVQNAMRRIIENYFGMLGERKNEKIESYFESAEEKQICKSLFSWINDGSHTIPDDLYIDSYTDSVERYKEIFHQIFIQSGNEPHYNMMMGIETDAGVEA